MPRPVKGERTPGSGRPKGQPNKLTRSAREAYQAAFEGIGGVPTFQAWAEANLTEFYKLHARLIPVEHVGEGGAGPISTVVKHVFETVSK